MTKTNLVRGTAAGLLVAALLFAFRLGFFAPSLAQVTGKPIEEIPLVDLEGHEHAFRELRGRPATLYFWATWCSPCLKHLASLAATKDPSSFDGFVPVAVDNDPHAVAAALRRIGYHGPMWVATDGMSLLQRRFAGNDRRAVPFEVKLNAAGNILGARYGE